MLGRFIEILIPRLLCALLSSDVKLLNKEFTNKHQKMENTNQMLR